MHNFTMRKNKKLNFNKNHYENAAWDAQSVVCGIDEVGRGCLAGPLVTAAVILPIGKNSRLFKDSKLMEPPIGKKPQNGLENTVNMLLASSITALLTSIISGRLTL